MVCLAYRLWSFTEGSQNQSSKQRKLEAETMEVQAYRRAPFESLGFLIELSLKCLGIALLSVAWAFLLSVSIQDSASQTGPSDGILQLRLLPLRLTC